LQKKITNKYAHYELQYDKKIYKREHFNFFSLIKSKLLKHTLNPPSLLLLPLPPIHLFNMSRTTYYLACPDCPDYIDYLDDVDDTCSKAFSDVRDDDKDDDPSIPSKADDTCSKACSDIKNDPLAPLTPSILPKNDKADDDNTDINPCPKQSLPKPSSRVRNAQKKKRNMKIISDRNMKHKLRNEDD
jgi:hypothetical protein